VNHQRDLTPEKKIELLNTYSSLSTIFLSGLFGGFSIIIIFVLIFSVLNFLLGNKNIFFLIWSPPIIYSVIFFSFAGIIAARLKKTEYTLKFPLVYFFFVFLIFLGLIIYLIDLYNRGEIEKIGYLGFSGSKVNFWSAIFISVVFISFVLANPIKQLWLMFYNLYLEFLSEIDYRALYNERYFYIQLREAVYNAKRYQISFSVILFKIANYDEIKKNFSKKYRLKIQNDILHILNRNLRETDIIGFLGGDDFYGILIYATLDNTRKAAERLKNLIEEKVFIKKQPYRIQISYNIWPFPSGDEKDIETTIREIVSPEKKNEIPIIKM